MARSIAGAEAIEIKATVPQHQVKAALKRYGLTERNDEKRYIYFFDTPKLNLLGAGIIARARRVVGDSHDSTVKFRPIDPDRVGPDWRRYPDFKIEADASEKGMVKSASFSMPVAKGVIRRVAIGKRPIAQVFTREQEKFLEAMTKHTIDFTRLAVLGPIMAHRWQFKDAACPWAITTELWIRADNARMMELSITAPAVQAAAAVGGFMAFLAEVGAERDQDQQNKTRWALEYYVAKLKRPVAGTAPANKAPPAKKRAKSPRRWAK